MERLIKLAGKEISIKLSKPGLYELGQEGCTGKSYLCKLLTGIEDILVLSYDDRDFLMDKINKYKPSIVIIDRFDMMVSERLLDSLSRLENTYVLLDLKNADKYSNYGIRFAVIVRTERGVYVHG